MQEMLEESFVATVYLLILFDNSILLYSSQPNCWYIQMSHSLNALFVDDTPAKR